MASLFVLTETGKGGFQFTFLAPDDQVLLTSPFFADKEEALSRIDMVRSLAGRASNLDIFSTRDGRFYIVLKDNKRNILGQSRIFADRQSLQKGMDIIKKCSRRTKLLDRTRLGGVGLASKNIQSPETIQKGPSPSSRIILTQNRKGYYLFTFQTTDGEVLLTSPFFTDKKYTLSRISLTRSLAQKNEGFEVRTAETGQLHIVLTNAKHEIIAQSPLFSHIRSMREWTALFQKCACDATLVDLTPSK